MSSFISNAFMLPNDLIDKGYMAHMKGPALPCYIFIVRKTRGWNKSDDSISVSQLVKGTGYNKDSVLKGCEKLVQMGTITPYPGYILIFRPQRCDSNAVLVWPDLRFPLTHTCSLWFVWWVALESNQACPEGREIYSLLPHLVACHPLSGPGVLSRGRARPHL